MLEQRTALKNIKHRTTLYRVVFESAVVKGAVFSLFVFLLIQPVAPAFAEGEETSAEEDGGSVVESVEPIVVDTGIEDVTSEDDSESQNQMADTDLPPTEDVATVEVTSQVTSVEFVEQTLGTEDDISDESEVLINQDIEDSDGDVQEVDETIASSSEDLLYIPTNEVATSTPPASSTSTEATSTPQDTEEYPEETDEVIDVPVADIPTTTDVLEESASTTNVVSTTTEVITPQVQTSPAFEFSTKECASVGDGAYYCSSVEDISDPLKDDIFSAPDVGGDMEIYVRLKGEERAITSNDTDDIGPYYDALSERVVWHRLIHDRYQVVSYDMKTNEETVLTNTNYNNMEPVAYENITLWQAWILNNWEIMMYDGVQVVQVTNNTFHDVSPHMRDGYIVWQTQFSDGWQVAVYDQKAKTVEYIPSESGLKVENPRFVLVYDSTDGNGDIQTLGYDLNNKKSFTLGSLPAELPEELPDPDQTGETRALIQNKQTSKEGEVEVIDTPVSSSNNSTSTTATEVGTLDLSQGTSTLSASTTSTTAVTDVIIPQYTATSSASQQPNPIEDLVIPPVLSTTTEEVR